MVRDRKKKERKKTQTHQSRILLSFECEVCLQSFGSSGGEVVSVDLFIEEGRGGRKVSGLGAARVSGVDESKRLFSFEVGERGMGVLRT